MKYILDAGPLIAALNSRDEYHEWADACIVRMSELMHDCRVVTLDRADFTVYRRNGRDLIPIIAPPAK